MRRDVSAPVVGGVLGGFAELHSLRRRALAERNDLPFLRLFFYSGLRRFELEQFALFHITLFLAVRPLTRVASGLVTLAGGGTAIGFPAR